MSTRRRTGYRANEPYELVNIRVIARGISEVSRVPDRIELDGRGSTTHPPERKVYYSSQRGWIKTPVVDRGSLDGEGSAGPLVIEEYDSGTLVPPGWEASLDPMKNIILSRTS